MMNVTATMMPCFGKRERLLPAKGKSLDLDQFARNNAERASAKESRRGS